MTRGQYCFCAVLYLELWLILPRPGTFQLFLVQEETNNLCLHVVSVTNTSLKQPPLCGKTSSRNRQFSERHQQCQLFLLVPPGPDIFVIAASTAVIVTVVHLDQNLFHGVPWLLYFSNKIDMTVDVLGRIFCPMCVIRFPEA